ncbi:MAG: hypothetical protein ACI3YF_02070, partial [Prevotella sp.]
AEDGRGKGYTTLKIPTQKLLHCQNTFLPFYLFTFLPFQNPFTSLLFYRFTFKNHRFTFKKFSFFVSLCS